MQTTDSLGAITREAIIDLGEQFVGDESGGKYWARVFVYCWNNDWPDTMHMSNPQDRMKSGHADGERRIPIDMRALNRRAKPNLYIREKLLEAHLSEKLVDSELFQGFEDIKFA